MQTIYLVGTLHGGLTPLSDLDEILNELKPGQIFVELTDEEVSMIGQKPLFRDEMVYLYNWSQENNIVVLNYDVENDILKTGIDGSEPEFQRLVGEQKKIFDQYSWKELNQPGVLEGSAEYRSVDAKLNELYIDQDKCAVREQKMLDQISAKIIPDGVVAIFCGTGHLKFFKAQLPNSVTYFAS